MKINKINKQKKIKQLESEANSAKQITPPTIYNLQFGKLTHVLRRGRGLGFI